MGKETVCHLLEWRHRDQRLIASESVVPTTENSLLQPLDETQCQLLLIPPISIEENTKESTHPVKWRGVERGQIISPVVVVTLRLANQV